jgi:hypothetical protein
VGVIAFDESAVEAVVTGSLGVGPGAVAESICGEVLVSGEGWSCATAKAPNRSRKPTVIATTGRSMTCHQTEF